MDAFYTCPVDRLLTFGTCTSSTHWPDYARQIGLGGQHVDQLICMASDPRLWQGDEDCLHVWAPIHACRALGQLRATAAVAPLLELLNYLEHIDEAWSVEELPEVFALIGPPALSQMTAFLADASNERFARMTVVEALQRIAVTAPESRDKCVAVMHRQLQRHAAEDVELNASLVVGLAQLEATESAGLIEEAFDAGSVNEWICGNWERIGYELGFGPQPPAPRWRYDPPDFAEPLLVYSSGGDHRSAKQKAKAKRKQAARSRRRNRRRR